MMRSKKWPPSRQAHITIFNNEAIVLLERLSHKITPTAKCSRLFGYVVVQFLETRNKMVFRSHTNDKEDVKYDSVPLVDVVDKADVDTKKAAGINKGRFATATKFSMMLKLIVLTGLLILGLGLLMAAFDLEYVVPFLDSSDSSSSSSSDSSSSDSSTSDSSDLFPNFAGDDNGPVPVAPFEDASVVGVDSP